MDKNQLRAWLRLTLVAGKTILDGHAAEERADWYGYIDEALGNLRAAQDSLNGDRGNGSVADVPHSHDHNAPYVCTACSLVYPVCPDFNAHDCPACGEKVCPVRLWRRAVIRCVSKLDDVCGIAQMVRTDGACLCPKCRLPHADHPYCANSELKTGESPPAYYLHVLCDGQHVKL